ncbi:MAG: DUF2807 domain-containing protein [Ignavibacteriales bacterium]|nr:DUF2807 domain-containing protein [Ignavibacteriales bacterium]
MKNLFFNFSKKVIAFFLFSVLLLNAQTTKDFDISDFSKIDLSGAFNVNITQGTSPKLLAKGDKDDLEFIEIKVEYGTLYISLKDRCELDDDIKLEIITKELNELECSGANEVEISDLNTNKFDLDISGACEVTIDGKTNEFNVDASGATDLNAKNFISEKVTLDVSGASDCSVYASDYLEVDISGVGNVDYYGDPEEVKEDVSWLCSLNKK